MKTIFAAVITAFFFASMSQAGNTDNLTVTTDNQAIVLPTELSYNLGQTCYTDGIVGPRVRLKVSMRTSGSDSI